MFTKYNFSNSSILELLTPFYYFKNYILGKGGYGQIFYGYITEEKVEEAFKKRKDEKSEKYFLLENILIRELNSFDNFFPKVYLNCDVVKEDYVVMSVIGPIIDDLVSLWGGRVELKTAWNIEIEVLEKKEMIHSKGLFHRDIKPNNFLWGLYNKSELKLQEEIFLSHLGLSWPFTDNYKTILDENDIRGAELGTNKFLSVCSHDSKPLRRKEDIEFLIYSIIELVNGCLPWDKFNNLENLVKKLKTYQIKKNITVDELLRNFPNELKEIFLEIKGYSFSQKPIYSKIKAKLIKIVKSEEKLTSNSQRFIWVEKIKQKLSKR